MKGKIDFHFKLRAVITLPRVVFIFFLALHTARERLFPPVNMYSLHGVFTKAGLSGARGAGTPIRILGLSIMYHKFLTSPASILYLSVVINKIDSLVWKVRCI